MCLIVPLGLDAMASFGGRPRDTLAEAEDSGSRLGGAAGRGLHPSFHHLQTSVPACALSVCACARVSVGVCVQEYGHTRASCVHGSHCLHVMPWVHQGDPPSVTGGLLLCPLV